jgi:HlyD family secretion protein
MISDSIFEIEATIPEVDVAKVKVGNKAVVWVEAFGKDVIFDAVVTRIDPAETLTDGVSTYKAILQFAEKDDRIKSGMTANIDIITSQKDDAVSVPSRAIQSNETGRFVLVKTADGTKEVTIKQGIFGKGGEREILEGLSGGEEIVIPAAK